jgi:hypothetical protein
MERELFWRIISDYGDLASVGGFLLSMVGFGLTIWSAQAARKAAERARQATMRLRSELLINDLRTSQQSIAETRHQLRRKSWNQALPSCDGLVIKLRRLSHDSAFNSEEKSRITAMVDDLKKTNLQAERAHRLKEKFAPESTLSNLTNLMDLLVQIEERLVHSQTEPGE